MRAEHVLTPGIWNIAPSTYRDTHVPTSPIYFFSFEHFLCPVAQRRVEQSCIQQGTHTHPPLSKATTWRGVGGRAGQRLRSRRKNNFPRWGQHQNPAPARKSLTRFPCQSSACQKAQADPSPRALASQPGAHRRQQTVRAQLREDPTLTSCTRLNCVAGAGAVLCDPLLPQGPCLALLATLR